MEDWKDIAIWVIGILFGIIGFIFKFVFTKVGENSDTCLILKEKVKSIDEVHEKELQSIKTSQIDKIDGLKTITEIQIGTLTTNVNKLTNTLEKHIEATERRMEQSESLNDSVKGLIKDFLEKK